MATTLTLSRATVALAGVSPKELQRPVLSPEATLALKPTLIQAGFNVTQPIFVEELPGLQGFHLTQ